MTFFIKQFSLHEGLIFVTYPQQNLLSKICHRLKGESRLAHNEISGYPTEILVNCRWIHALGENRLVATQRRQTSFH